MRAWQMFFENAIKNAEKNGKTLIIIDPAGERKEQNPLKTCTSKVRNVNDQFKERG